MTDDIFDFNSSSPKRELITLDREQLRIFRGRLYFRRGWRIYNREIDWDPESGLWVSFEDDEMVDVFDIEYLQMIYGTIKETEEKDFIVDVQQTCQPEYELDNLDEHSHLYSNGDFVGLIVSPDYDPYQILYLENCMRTKQ